MSLLLTITFTTTAFRTAAAYGSLKPPPTRRLRRAFLHLSYSMTISRLPDTTTPVARSGRGHPAGADADGTPTALTVAPRCTRCDIRPRYHAHGRSSRQ